MRCPVCGEKTKIIDTRGNCESVIRWRKCLSCNYHYKTIELEVDLVESLQSNKQGDKKKK